MKKLALTILTLSIPCAMAQAADWPQWRGPSGNGVSPEKGLPVTWSQDKGIAWRARLDGQGVSSPIVSGDQVIVTSQIGRGDVRPGNHPMLGQRGGDLPAERSIGGTAQDTVVFLVEAYNRKNGKRLWQYRLPAERTAESLPEVHQKTNLANPSPSTDGERIYAWFGTGQFVALDMKGKVVWQKHLAKEYGPYAITWGHSSSPTIYGNSLILLCDHDPASYLLALDKKTGKEMWKADRGKGLRYSTPIVVSGPGGDELIVNSSQRLEGYDPKTGQRLWHYEEANQFPIHVPSFSDGVIFMSRGYRSGPYMAIRPGGRGDIAGTKNLLWHVPTGAPYVSSLVHYQGVVYLASDAGILQAAEAETGKRLFQGRTGNLYSAAPVAGDGKVYFVSETGETVVLKASREFEILARNQLDGRFLASPVIANGLLLLRSDDELIAVGNTPN
jgi:outer membrane protein assembly factor BamB